MPISIDDLNLPLRGARAGWDVALRGAFTEMVDSVNAQETATDNAVSVISGAVDTNDAAVAATVSSGPATTAALNSTFGKRDASATRTVVFGDSITEQNQGNPASSPTVSSTVLSSRGYFTWANAWLGGQLDLVRNAGIGGNRSDQMLARIDADVLAYNPKLCIVFGGANDITQGYSAASIIANLTSIYDLLDNAGVTVVVGTIYRTVTMESAPEALVMATVNAWIRDTATTRGYPLADFYGAVTDPATGYPPAAYLTDGVHPSQEGAMRMGLTLARTLHSVLPARDLFSTSATDSDAILNGSMTGGGPGVGVLATGWTAATLSGTPVYRTFKRARESGLGEWQCFSFGPNSDGEISFFRRGAAATLAAGEVFEAFIEFETEECDAATSGMYLDARVIVETAANGYLGIGVAAEAAGINSTVLPSKGVFRIGRVTAPNDTDHVLAQVRIFGVKAGTVRIGRFFIRKVA